MIRFDGDLLLDPVRRVIVWRGCVQHVPPTAFGLLWLLGANAGAPFSTEKVCVELEGSCTPASVRRVWEHMEETIAFVRDFSGGELQVASERGKGYALRRGNIVPVD
jgi:DNA-binding response OmpR family regulator